MGAKLCSDPHPTLKGEAFGLLLGNVFSIMMRGQAYLGVLAGNSILYTYRYVPSNSDMSSNPSDAWIIGLLAIARNMPDIVYTTPQETVFWVS
jgi:hypothetical protein